MKKIFKSVISAVMAVTLMLSFFATDISAASATISLSPNKSSYNVGEEVNVTVNFTGTSLYAIDGTLEFDSSVMVYKSGAGNCTGNTVKIVETLNGENKVSYSIRFVANAPGKNYFKFSAEGSGDKEERQSASAGVTVNVAAASTPATSPDPAEISGNADLSSIRVSSGTLSPAFSASVTEYNVTVSKDTEKVTVSASAADGTAKISGVGTYSLNVGSNRKTITVTAANGTKKSYNINFIRQDEQGTGELPTDNSDPLIVNIDGADYRFMNDISTVSVPDGYTVTDIQKGDITIPMLVDNAGTTTLCYITNSDNTETTMYKYLPDGSVEKLLYLSIYNRLYIIAEPDSDLTAPSGYYTVNVSVNGGQAMAYCSDNSALAGFYIFYCLVDGKYGFYRYDQADSTIQRVPDFVLVKATSADAKANNGSNALLNTLRNMNSTGKIIVILAVLAVICIIVLIILLIVKIVKGNNDIEPPVFSSEKDNGMFDDGDYNSAFNFGDDDE